MKDDEKGKKRASTCETAVLEYVETGRELLGSRSPRNLILSEFYLVNFVNVECPSVREEMHCFMQSVYGYRSKARFSSLLVCYFIINYI